MPKTSQQIISLILSRHNLTSDVVISRNQTAAVSNCRALLYASLLRYSELSLEGVMAMFGRSQKSVSEQVNRILKTFEWKEVKELIKQLPDC